MALHQTGVAPGRAFAELGIDSERSAAKLIRRCASGVRRRVWWIAIYGAASLGATYFEPSHHLAQMAGHAAAHEEKAMEVVGHDGAFKQLHLGMEARYLPPAVGDGLAERREGDTFAGKASENRATALHFEGDHVDAAFVVVVAKAPTLHGMDDGAFHTTAIIGNDSGFSKEAA